MKKLQTLFIASLLLVGASCCPKEGAKECCKKGGTLEQPIGVQLYSLRHEIGNDFDGTIKLLGDIGYQTIEAAGYGDGKFYGKTPEEFKAAIEAVGMKVLSSHAFIGLEDKEVASKDFSKSLAKWDAMIAAHKATGMKYIVCAGIGVPDKLAELQTYCDYFNAIGKKCKEQGLEFGYHNHSHEFEEVEAVTMYNYMLEHTDPALVLFQMDVYWTVMAKKSPVELFKQYPGRFKLLHIKDHRELGQSGMVGFDAIFKNLEVAGTKEFIVEIEAFTNTPAEGMKACFDYLKSY
ncbi:sugar phosphate isomerase [Bacteroidia bacterium]|nr:sugar phosphate isomerase [Bacteroidia bacterium]